MLIKLFRAFVVMLLAIAPVGIARAGSLYAVPKYAAILIDAQSGEVLYARQADATRYPASITKVMTLYVAFEEMAAGRLRDDDLITISANAARQPPSKLGLRPGATISVRDAMGVMVTRSANDIAMALAEHIGGSQTAFADRMNTTAQRLGMAHSWFRNPSGLPDPAHVSTARDIALLSRALVRDFPERYRLFSTVAYDYRGQSVRNHNHLLDTLPGVDGIKTGFTQMAGFTLAASATQNGVRLIAVVLGGPNRFARDNNVGDLLQAGFDVLNARQRGVLTTVAANFAEPDDLNDQVILRLTDEEPVLGGVAVSAASAANQSSFAATRARPLQP